VRSTLFVGQAQKEAWVNEAHARIDALLHCTIEGVRADPPAAPNDGEAWIVAAGATGAWASKDGMIATRQGDNWILIPAREGMRVLDLSTRQELLFSAVWQAPVPPVAPTGGATIDVEARAAIAQLIAALRVSGVFPET
jgi:hypothetical protein